MHTIETMMRLCHLHYNKLNKNKKHCGKKNFMSSVCVPCILIFIIHTNATFWVSLLHLHWNSEQQFVETEWTKKQQQQQTIQWACCNNNNNNVKIPLNEESHIVVYTHTGHFNGNGGESKHGLSIWIRKWWFFWFIFVCSYRRWGQWEQLTFMHREESISSKFHLD